jgi:hypothetical protein
MELWQLREEYQKAVDSELIAQKIWEASQRYAGDKAIIHAYGAASRALLSNHSWNPLEKLKMIKESMKLFRRAVRMDSLNPEIRFLRFSIQVALPGYLKMADEVEEDKKMILDQLPNFAQFGLEKYHLEPIIDFIKRSDHFRQKERNLLLAQIEN